MNTTRGFTLIEILIVVGIIGILSAIGYTIFNEARIKSHDAQRVSDLREVSLALELFYQKNGSYPPFLNNWAPGGAGDQLEDNFELMAEELLQDGFLSRIPRDPNPSQDRGYRYYLYTATSQTNEEHAAAGALIVADLKGIDITTEAVFDSCRPFTGNWCSYTLQSSEFCLCHPFNL